MRQQTKTIFSLHLTLVLVALLAAGCTAVATHVSVSDMEQTLVDRAAQLREQRDLQREQRRKQRQEERKAAQALDAQKRHAAPVEKAELRLHQLYINSAGDLVDPATKTVIPDRDEQAYIEAILANIERHTKPVSHQSEIDGRCTTGRHDSRPGAAQSLQLVIYIHGGLNSFEEAVERGELLREQMLKDGKYPLFISWDSEFTGAYRDHLFSVRRGLHRRTYAGWTAPFLFIEDLARSIIRLPSAMAYVIPRGIRSQFDPGMRNTGIRFEQYLQGDANKKVDGCRELVPHLPPDWDKDGDEPFDRDRQTILNPIKIGTAALVDGLGTGAWGAMLRRADLVLQKSADFESREPVEVLQEGGEQLGTAVSKFLRLWQERHGSEPPADVASGTPVVLVAHSMGTIIANQIVSRYQRINWSRIVYMAAACKIKDVEFVIPTYLERNQKAHFYNLSLHPDHEVDEHHYWDMIRRGSLLVWIDQTLGQVNSLQDRTAGSWHNIASTAKLMFRGRGLAGRVHLTRFRKNRPSPIRHAELDEYRFWCGEFWRAEERTRVAELSRDGPGETAAAPNGSTGGRSCSL